MLTKTITTSASLKVLSQEKVLITKEDKCPRCDLEGIISRDRIVCPRCGQTIKEVGKA